MTPDAEDPAAGAGGPQEPPTPFQILCGMLATQVHMALGYIPDPVDGKVRVELAAAREGIDLLAMLEEKTKGNLEEKEAKTVGVLLANLRLTFVERVKEVQEHRAAQGDATDEGTDEAKPDEGPTIVTP